MSPRQCIAEGSADAIARRVVPGSDDAASPEHRLSWRMAAGFMAATSLALWFALWKVAVGAAEALG